MGRWLKLQKTEDEILKGPKKVRKNAKKPEISEVSEKESKNGKKLIIWFRFLVLRGILRVVIYRNLPILSQNTNFKTLGNWNFRQKCKKICDVSNKSSFSIKLVCSSGSPPIVAIKNNLTMRKRNKNSFEHIQVAKKYENVKRVGKIPSPQKIALMRGKTENFSRSPKKNMHEIAKNVRKYAFAFPPPPAATHDLLISSKHTFDKRWDD